MAIQCSALKPLLSPTKQNPLQYKTSTSHRKTTPLLVKAVESVPWEVQIPPNVVRQNRDLKWSGGSTLGVYLRSSRTGVAISKKGSIIRPLTVAELRGKKLQLWLLDLAEKQDVDEFIVGLPRSSGGREKEAEWSNDVGSVATTLAYGAAKTSRRVYLQQEDETFCEAVKLMTAEGLGRVEAYAAMKLLERYFSNSGKGIQLIMPDNIELQYNLRRGRPTDIDYY